MLEIAVLGAGRIGRIHAGNIGAHPDVRLAGVADTVPAAAAHLAVSLGARVLSVDDALRADAVLIASPTPTHADYINAARQHAAGERPDLAIGAERPERYAPQRGDLICMWRGSQAVRYDDLPTGRFPGHCDIVVEAHPGLLDVIGGNVDNSVSMKQIPVTQDGHLAGPDGVIVDPDYPWFVAIRVEYDIN